MHEKIDSGEVTVWKIWYQNNLFLGDVCVCIHIYIYNIYTMRGEIRRRRPNSCSPSRRLVENPGGNSWWDRGVRASSCPPRAEGGKENKGEARR